jgi:dTMP kinase
MMTATPTRPQFIVFEGLDGSGKSTCARRTAELLGARFMTTPCESLRDCREQVVASFAGSQEAAHCFYLATVMAASRAVERHLAAGVSVVLDRYLLSTQVYAEFRGSTLPLPPDNLALIRPADLTVFLDAPRDVRVARASQRQQVTTADRETFGEEADRRLRDGYERWFCHPVTGQLLRLDSAKADVETLAREIVGVATKVARCSRDDRPDGCPSLERDAMDASPESLEV